MPYPSRLIASFGKGIHRPCQLTPGTLIRKSFSKAFKNVFHQRTIGTFSSPQNITIMTTYAELQQKIAELQSQAEELRKRELAEIIADVKQKIAAYGLSAADLGLQAGRESTAAPQKAKTALKAKYRDPATGETWVGRGATPKWMRAYLEAGRNKDEFLI